MKTPHPKGLSKHTVKWRVSQPVRPELVLEFLSAPPKTTRHAYAPRPNRKIKVQVQTDLDFTGQLILAFGGAPVCLQCVFYRIAKQSRAGLTSTVRHICSNPNSLHIGETGRAYKSSCDQFSVQ